MTVLGEWSRSTATNPDLLPRSVMLMGVADFDSVIWLLQRLLGAGCLALRPHLWRTRIMCPKHKAGSLLNVDNWRQVEICLQLGLLQECLVVARFAEDVRNYILPCQSGYVRDVSDAHLVIHELCAEARGQHRALWCVPADVWKAFPRTWRQDFIDILRTGPGVDGGTLALVGSILERNDVVVPLGGCS